MSGPSPVCFERVTGPLRSRDLPGDKDALVGGRDTVPRGTGGPVAVVIPQLGHELVEPVGVCSRATLARLIGYARDRVAGRPVPVPNVVAHEVSVHSGDALLGMVLLL